MPRFFCSLSYDDYSSYFTGKVNVGMFVSMNATKEFYDRLYKEQFEEYAKELEMLGGKVVLYPCYLCCFNYLISYFNLVNRLINDQIKTLDNDIKLEHT